MKPSAPLTHERLLELIKYDPATGLFTHKKDRWNHVHAGKSAGCEHAGAIYLTLEYRKYSAARVAWFYVYGVWPIGNVLRRNKNKADNRIENLYGAVK
jgi:hypothetical protein